MGAGAVCARAPCPRPCPAALSFDDLMGAPAAPQQQAATSLGGLGAGSGGVKLPPPPAKKDPFADLLG